MANAFTLKASTCFPATAATSCIVADGAQDAAERRPAEALQ